MKKITLILLCLVITFSLAACGKKAEAEKETVTQTASTPSPEGDLIIRAVSYPSPLLIHYLTDDNEELVKQEYKNLTDIYEIFSSGDVRCIDEVVRLKDEDLKAMLEYYDRFCKNEVTMEKDLITDLGRMDLTAYDEDKKPHIFEYGSSKRCIEVGEVMSILYPYFEQPSIWSTVGAEE